MLSVNNIAIGYQKDELVLKDISFTLNKGKILAIIGPNGSGKTTLLRCINAVLKPSTGLINIEERNVLQMKSREIAKKIGYVPQTNKSGHMTVFDAILLGRIAHVNVKSSHTDLQIVSRALQRLNIEHLVTRYTSHLSGGELQKVCIARALVQEPELFLFDEPTSNLDLKNQMDIMKIIRYITAGNNLSAVMTFHDLNLAFRFADQLILLNKGQIIETGSPHSFRGDILSDIYEVGIELIRRNGHIMVNIV